MPTDSRPQLRKRLQSLQTSDFRDGHLELLKTLGYKSDKTMPIPKADPARFIEMAEAGAGVTIDKAKARYEEWDKADILFQLTDEELSGQTSLFDATELKPKLLQSYLFFAIALKGTRYSRTDLSNITRQINRLFPMPVMVFYTYNGELSIAVINRRRNKREDHKDVLGKVTLIHGINLTDPHRGHLDILDSFSVAALTIGKQRIDSFDALHAAWEAIFNVELLNKKFYRELSNWYFWAMRHCHFPLLDEASDRYFLFKDREKVREHEAKNLIRLLTRILFVWFIKERNLVPDALFDPSSIRDGFLEGFDPESKDTRYYKAILQNLFFAVLNQTHGKREFRKQGQHHNTTNLLRYEALLKDPKRFVQTVEAVTPFLNGGLFDCLDYPHPTKKGPQGGAVTIYEDGFSDRKDNPLVVPDFLFFGAEQKGVDLSAEFGDPKKKNETVRGLIHILDGYKFTVVENTPIEQEIALDPELLGQVFENLLASYNEETKTTARKQTGSFYTPRPIVDYMVGESLKAHLRQALVRDAGMAKEDAQEGLDILFAYTEREHAFNDREKDVLIRAIDTCKILDPACGSGAFPMGALQKLVFILGKLDPRDELWEKRQLAKVDKLIEAAQDIDDTTFRERAIADAEAQKSDIEEAFANNELGYGRKLYLIENCLYGVDIQSIATQVSKLRFFISLVVDQKVDARRENFGVRPLPNLETKFVTADTLIQIAKKGDQLSLGDNEKVSKLQQELRQVRHELFAAKTPRTKNAKRQRDKELRQAIAAELKQNGWQSDAADKLAAWDPYDQNASAPYFDPEWMFGFKGFDIVIGNPPYVLLQAANKDKSKTAYFRNNFKVASYKVDLYHLFIEHGANLLSPNGVISYITPSNFVSNNYSVSLRKFLLDETYLDRLIFFAEGVFEASVHNLVFIAHNSESEEGVTSFNQAKVVEGGVDIEVIHTAKRSELLNEKCLLIPKLSSGADDILRKMDEKSKSLGALASVNFGMQLRNRKIYTEDVVQLSESSSLPSKYHRACYAGRDIHRYYLSFSDKFCYFNREAKQGGCWDEDIHNAQNKILVRQIGAYPEGGLDIRGFAVLNAAFMILPTQRGIYKYLLGIINSRCIQFYWKNKFQDDRKTFPKIKGEYLKLLPIPDANKTDRKAIDELVDQVISAKELDGSANTSELEHRIDEKIYALFRLDPDEIQAVEDATK